MRRLLPVALGLALLAGCCPAPQSAASAPETAFAATVLKVEPEALTVRLASGETLRVEGAHPGLEPGGRVYVRGLLYPGRVAATSVDALGR